MIEDAKILIVDDDGRNLDALDAMLAPTGCALVRAHSADEALLALLRDDFAAMILDIRMPGTSGFELASLIKQRRRTQHVPILFLTAHHVEDEDVRRGYGAGAVDYLSKPVNADILRSKMAVFVELHRQSRALAALNEELQREVAARRRAQESLEQLNLELERRVAERTAALDVALVNERRARDEAERQGRIKDEFLATLSHELRTPMNAILGWLSMLAKGEGVRNPQQAMAAIQRNAQVQARLIEDLLEMNKLTSGNVRLDLEPMDLEPTLQAALESLRPTADAKGVQLSARVDSPLPLIQADARRVQQILWNLIQNGVKFTRPGGRVEVQLQTSPRDNALRIDVRDTGEGIAPDFLPFVFERFRQAEPSSARGASGLGLGLSIVKHLVELHGGAISASSPGPNCGSTFVITLPALPAAFALAANDPLAAAPVAGGARS